MCVICVFLGAAHTCVCIVMCIYMYVAYQGEVRLPSSPGRQSFEGVRMQTLLNFVLKYAGVVTSRAAERHDTEWLNKSDLVVAEVTLRARDRCSEQ
jgi:hypothetical protein